MAEDCDVLVVGGGPVGLLVAYELQARGVSVTLIERNQTTTSHPKMDITNGRSLELMRRFGLTEILRDAAVPRDHPMDVVWLSRFAEWELARFRYRNTIERQELIRATNDGAQPLEPDLRMSQVLLEPLLRDLLIATGKCDVRYGVEFVGLEQDEHGVTATVRDTRTGELETIHSQYLAGCDGGSSKVRGELGIQCSGAWSVARLFMVHFEVEDPEVMRRHGIAWHYQSPVGGTLIAQDDDRILTLHVPINPELDPASVDPKQILYDALGFEFPCTILASNAWTPHLVVADSYGSGRVWLAGDAAHQYIPTGGYGMNTGVGDAANLAWKFAAMVQGWGGPALLPTIDSERRPVGQANCQAAGENAGVRFQIAAAYTDEIHLDTPAGAAARAKLGETILALGNAENESRGIEFGYRYRQSPIIVRGDDDIEPAWSKLDYVPSAWPGARPPHLFLGDGSALFDHFGPGFTLLDLGGDGSAAMEQAASEIGMPLSVVPIREPRVRELYERNYVLIRPDQMVAWRGDSLPANCTALLKAVTGGLNS